MFLSLLYGKKPKYILWKYNVGASHLEIQSACFAAIILIIHLWLQVITILDLHIEGTG